MVVWRFKHKYDSLNESIPVPHASSFDDESASLNSSMADSMAKSKRRGSIVYNKDQERQPKSHLSRRLSALPPFAQNPDPRRKSALLTREDSIQAGKEPIQKPGMAKRASFAFIKQDPKLSLPTSSTQTVPETLENPKNRSKEGGESMLILNAYLCMEACAMLLKNTEIWALEDYLHTSKPIQLTGKYALAIGTIIDVNFGIKRIRNESVCAGSAYSMARVLISESTSKKCK